MHLFLKDKAVSLADVQELVCLTKAGQLSWTVSSTGYVLWADSPGPVVYRDQAALGSNLITVRLAYKPNGLDWYGLDLQSADGRWHLVDEDSPQAVRALVDQLLGLAHQAARAGGRLAAQAPAATPLAPAV